MGQGVQVIQSDRTTNDVYVAQIEATGYPRNELRMISIGLDGREPGLRILPCQAQGKEAGVGAKVDPSLALSGCTFGKEPFKSRTVSAPVLVDLFRIAESL